MVARKKDLDEPSAEAPAGGVLAIQLVLSILENLAKNDTVGVTELSKSLGTTKARVFRHLRTLVDHGYADQDTDSERYSAGPRLVGLSRIAAITPDEGLKRLARPVMVRLRDRFGHTANLSLVYGLSASIEESLTGNSFVGVVMQTKQAMPLHSTAAGKLLLAHMLERGIGLPEPPLERFTENTITDPITLRIELGRVREQGWAAAPEETVLGVNAISAPISDHRGDLVAMLSLVSSIQFISRQPPRDMIEAVREGAAEISRLLELAG